MATKLASLPIVNGGLGAAVPTGGLAAQTAPIVRGVTGTIDIESSSDGVHFCTAATFYKNGKEDQIVTVAAAYMRVNAEKGTADSACVCAESGIVRSGVIPSPPVSGKGATLDISSFGPETTCYVDDLPKGTSVGIEISCDGVHWSVDFKTWTGNGCLTKNIAARFIRAVGLGKDTSGVVIGISSMEPVGEAGQSCVMITAADSPYDAVDSETIFADTTGGPIIINAPLSAGNGCDTFTVKDYGGVASINPITVVPQPGEWVEHAVIDNNCDAQTWVSDGLGNWPATSDYDKSALDDVTIIKSGILKQLAVSDDEAQSLLCELNQVFDMILVTLECR
jgi:hypothetical protein